MENRKASLEEISELKNEKEQIFERVFKIFNQVLKGEKWKKKI